jgi:DNA-binding transcriptional ArsR family regulator
VTASASAVLDALGDKSRRSIFEKLADGPIAVGALAELLPISRPAVSQHLRVLKEADLVVESVAGTRRLYRINHAGLMALRGYLDQFWVQTLAGFKEIVESQVGDE